MNSVYAYDGGKDDKGILLVLDKHTVLWDDGTIVTYWYDVIEAFNNDYRAKLLK